METNKHGIAKVWPDGKVAWVNALDGAHLVGGGMTPAVTPEGDVIAEMKSSASVFIVKLRESDGGLVSTSPPLSTTYFDFLSSASVVGDSIFTSVESPPSGKDLIVLNKSDLTVKAMLQGTGADWSPPYVRGADLFIGTAASGFAAISKFSAVTLAPDTGFGTEGTVHFDTSGFGAYLEVSAAPRSADQNPGGTIYASIQSSLIAKVVSVDAINGNVRTLYSSGTNGGLGMVVSARNIVAYGDAKTFIMFGLAGSNIHSFTLAGRPQRPTYDATTDHFFVSTIRNPSGLSYLVGFDSL